MRWLSHSTTRRTALQAAMMYELDIERGALTFRKAIDSDGPPKHARHAAEGDMGRWWVYDVLIDLIRQHQQPRMLCDHLC